MERLSGFKFDDVAGMHGAGIDTEEVVRTGMIAFMEGAMIGIFHGDLHGGNLFVLPDGRTALLDFGIVGRLDDARRRAFLRLMLGATTNDVKGQLAALGTSARCRRTRTCGRLSRTCASTSLRRSDDAEREELVKEVQRVVKALLGYGARMPKELMLYVKNMVFLDGAIARLAPDLDILAEIANISLHFAQAHGERLGRELGIDQTQMEVNLDGVKASLGLNASTQRMTYRDLQKRRELINKRMRDHVRSPPDRAATVGGMRLVIARCRVDYDGRLAAHLPEAVRLLMVKADGCVAVHADGGAYKPLNWMRTQRPAGATGSLGDHQPQGRAADHRAAGGVQRHGLGHGRRPRPAEGRRRGPPPGAAGRRPRPLRRPDAGAPRVPDRARPGRPSMPWPRPA